MIVKLCGVRTVQDALLCAEAGADEIGVVFAARSRRRVTVEEARAIRAALPPAVALVGVFLDAPLDEVLATARAAGLSAAQLHGHWPAKFGDTILNSLRREPAGIEYGVPEFSGGGGLPLYAALQVRDAASLLPRSGAARLLLDGPAGGSGQRFDWALSHAARKAYPGPIFIAGGLDADNVAQAIEAARPDGVDVSSGIEGADGFKDPARVRAFVRAARSAIP